MSRDCIQTEKKKNFSSNFQRDISLFRSGPVNFKKLHLTLHYRKRFDDTGYVSEYFIAFKFDHNHKSYCNICHKEISPLKDYFTQLPGGKEAKTLY